MPASRRRCRSRASSTSARTCADVVIAGASRSAADGRSHVDEEVDPVQQRPAEPAAVTSVILLGAAAARGARVTARARVRRRDEHEARRVERRLLSPHDDDAAVLERLAQSLQGVAGELRELVEEQHAVMGEARLARRRHRPAADQAGRRDGVVRRPEGPACDEPGARAEPGDGVDPGDLDGLAAGQRRAGSRAGGAPASSCRCRAGRRAAGCGRRRPRSSGLAADPG